MTDSNSILDEIWGDYGERVLKDVGTSWDAMRNGPPVVVATPAAERAHGFEALRDAAVGSLLQAEGDAIGVALDVCPPGENRLLGLLEIRHLLRPPEAWKIALFTTNSMRGFFMSEGTFDQYRDFISEKLLGL